MCRHNLEFTIFWCVLFLPDRFVRLANKLKSFSSLQIKIARQTVESFECLASLAGSCRRCGGWKRLSPCSLPAYYSFSMIAASKAHYSKYIKCARLGFDTFDTHIANVYTVRLVTLPRCRSLFFSATDYANRVSRIAHRQIIQFYAIYSVDPEIRTT